MRTHHITIQQPILPSYSSIINNNNKHVNKPSQTHKMQRDIASGKCKQREEKKQLQVENKTKKERERNINNPTWLRNAAMARMKIKWGCRVKIYI